MWKSVERRMRLEFLALHGEVFGFRDEWRAREKLRKMDIDQLAHSNQSYRDALRIGGRENAAVLILGGAYKDWRF